MKELPLYTLFNSLSPTSDRDRISPYTVNIDQGIIGWSNSKFSKLTLYKLYSRQLGELLMKSWELKG